MSTKAVPNPATKVLTCLCKSVSVTVTGNDRGFVACHCSNCQKASGAAFAYNNRVNEAEAKITRGEDVIKKYADSETTSGNTLYRNFCGNCGSPLFIEISSVPHAMALQSGALEGERGRPSQEFYPHNKMNWVGELLDKSKASQM